MRQHRDDRPGFYRARNGMIFGVCKGIARHLDMPTAGVRIIAVLVALFTTLWPTVLAYIIAALIMKPEPVVPIENDDEEEFYNSYVTSRSMALARLKRTYDNLDRRIQRIENIVTAPDYDWERRLHESLPRGPGAFGDGRWFVCTLIRKGFERGMLRIGCVSYVKLALAAVVLCALAAGVRWTSGECVKAAALGHLPDGGLVTKVEQWDVTLPANGVVRVKNAAGSVSVTGWDEPWVQVHVEKEVDTRYTSLPSADSVKVACSLDKQELTLASTLPDGPDAPFCAANWTIRAPRTMQINVHNQRGSIECEGMYGRVDAATGQGAVRMRDVRGPIAADTSSGAIELALAAHAQTLSAIRCKTLDGPIRLHLPKQTGFDLTVAALNSPFECDFPLAMDAPAGPHAFKARAGNGGPAITLDTLDGPIRIQTL